jgi:hypothetical protein
LEAKAENKNPSPELAFGLSSFTPNREALANELHEDSFCPEFIRFSGPSPHAVYNLHVQYNSIIRFVWQFRYLSPLRRRNNKYYK